MVTNGDVGVCGACLLNCIDIIIPTLMTVCLPEGGFCAPLGCACEKEWSPVGKANICVSLLQYAQEGAENRWIACKEAGWIVKGKEKKNKNIWLTWQFPMLYVWLSISHSLHLNKSVLCYYVVLHGRKHLAKKIKSQLSSGEPLTVDTAVLLRKCFL